MSGHVELEAFIARVEAIGKLNERVAREAEEPVADVVRATAAAGTTPTGEAWPERSGGGKALPNASKAIESSVKANRITLKIGKPYVYHQHGAGGTSTTKAAERARKASAKKREESGKKSKFHAPRREIIPVVGKPVEAIADAIETVAKSVFADAMGGG